MQQVEIQLKKIYEHDMDLLILEQFAADKGFARLFLAKLGLDDDYTVSKLIHSYADANGESDITIILQYPDEKVAILIEDKIDAVTMPEQSKRYYIRGDAGKTRGEYNRYFVMLAAPADYIREHENDANAAYEYTVSYEELRDYLQVQDGIYATFKAAEIDFAISEKKSGYQVIEVKSVTEFWAKLRHYCKENFPALKMLGTDAPKGSRAAWPEFATSLPNVKIIYKSQKGYVDLEFPGYGDKLEQLGKIISANMSKEMCLCKTGKSASVRLFNERWAVDFTDSFENNEIVIDEVLCAAVQMKKLTDSLKQTEF